MTEDTSNDLPIEDEIVGLKARADLMGIKYHPSIGVAALKEKIAGAVVTDTPVAPAPEPEGETALQTAQRLKREATELIRCRIVCMNPNKKDWTGEIYTVGNAVVGTIKKFVMFDVEYHVPRMILTQLEEKQCQVFYTHTDPVTRNKSRKGKLVKEFSIELLPQLTEQELKDLAQRQAMANGTSA